MDRNLERNLMKVEALRAKGDLDKARRKLSELARDHPDTPDYRLELARICLELGDHRTGLRELRQALRQAPDRRADLLAIAESHFQTTGDTHAAQFLFEDHLARGDTQRAVLVLERLTEAQLRQLFERYTVKLDSVAGGEPAAGAPAGEDATVRLALWGGFHCALALKQHEAAAAHATRLLRGDPKSAKRLLSLLERRTRSTQLPAALLAVLGEARIREGKAPDGLAALLAASERDHGLVPRLEETCALLAPQLDGVPEALRTRGHLARLAGRHDDAIALYREAAHLDPHGTRPLLELIAQSAGGAEGKPYALFRIELLALSGDDPALRAALDPSRRPAGTEPGELLAILAPQIQGENPRPALIAMAAQLAANAGDVGMLEKLLPACERLPRDQLSSVAVALAECAGVRAAPAARRAPADEPQPGDGMSKFAAFEPAAVILDPGAEPSPSREAEPPEPPAAKPASSLAPEARAACLRLLARLQAALDDAEGANASLALLWQAPAGGDAAHDELLSFTREILASVPPTAATLAAALPVAARRGELPDLVPWLAAVPYDDPDTCRAVEQALTDLALADARHARALCEAPQAQEMASRGPLALPLAVSRLRAGEPERGLRELSALVATRPELEGRELEILLACCRGGDAPAQVALAAARTLRLEGRLEEAMAALRPALGHDPARAEEICLFFESLLADEPGRADIWLCYLDGLQESGRRDRLAQLLPQAEARLPASEIGRLRIYRVRLLFESGDLPAALSECELVLQLAEPPLALLEELLRAALTVSPGLGRAHRLLGTIAFATERFEDGLRCCAQALRCDPGLQAEILHTVRRLAEQRRGDAAGCLALARFYLECGRGDDAAGFYLQVLEADASRADAVATDLHDAAEADAPFLSLLEPRARALRLAGRLAEVEAAYTALYAREPSRVDWIFGELDRLEAAHPGSPQAARARARILLAEKRLVELEALVGAALERPGAPEERWLLAREFIGALLDSPTVPLLAAGAAAETGRREPSLAWLGAWAAQRDRLDDAEYERALAVLERLGPDQGDWAEREARCRVHLLGGRAELAFPALTAPAGLDEAQLATGCALLEALVEALPAAADVRLQLARYLAALGRPEQVLAALEGPDGTATAAGTMAEELRREASALRAQALAALGRHDEAMREIRERLRSPEAQEEAMAALRAAQAAEAEALRAQAGEAGELAPEERREVAVRLARAGLVDEALRILAEPCAEPAQEQARRVAEAELLGFDDRLLEALEVLRAVPLTGEACLLTPTARAAALWLRAHGEEARGQWAAACACYRALAAMPDGVESARRWWSWSYGRMLEGSPLVLEKTTTLV